MQTSPQTICCTINLLLPFSEPTFEFLVNFIFEVEWLFNYWIYLKSYQIQFYQSVKFLLEINKFIKEIKYDFLEAWFIISIKKFPPKIHHKTKNLCKSKNIFYTKCWFFVLFYHVMHLLAYKFCIYLFFAC